MYEKGRDEERCIVISSCILLLALLYFQPLHAQSTAFAEISSSDLSIETFSTNDDATYKTSLLYNGVLYIGGKGVIHRQNAGAVSKEAFPPIVWKVSNSSRQTCMTYPQGNEGNCENFIRLIQPYNETHILLCGTFALYPQNKFLNIQNGTLHQDDIITTPLCSYDSTDNITSSLATKGGEFSSIVATSRAQILSPMTIVKNLPGPLALRATQGKEKMIDEDAKFVASFIANDTMNGQTLKKIYFVFGESAREPGRNKFGTRIAQVCANDVGGSDQFKSEFTSFLKVPLLCQTDEKTPFPFDIVTDVVVSEDGILYGTFTTQTSKFRSSAICAYKLSEIQREFHNGNFLIKNKDSGIFEPVQYGPTQPTPGICSYPGMNGNVNATSNDFPPEFIKFMSTHPLVDGAVKPTNFQTNSVRSLAKSAGPLFDRSVKFSKIAVVTTKAVNGRKHNVLYVGTEEGKVIKVLSLNKESNVETIELSQYDVADESILDMFISSDSHLLYVATTSNVLQLPTENCASYTKSCKFCDPCRMCVLSRDPMCAWDKTINECTKFRSGSNGDESLIQDVMNGNPDICGPLSTTQKAMKAPTYGSPFIFGNVIKSSSISTKWFRMISNEKQLITESDHYHITAEGRLEISTFDESDMEKYLSEYKMGTTPVASEMFILSDEESTSNKAVVTVTRNNGSTVITDKSMTSAGTIADRNGIINIDVGTTQTNAHQLYMGVISITAISLSIILVVILVMLCLCVRGRLRSCFKIKKSEKPTVNGSAVNDVTDSVGLRNMTNSNNVHSNKQLCSISSCEEEDAELLEKDLERSSQTAGLQERQIAAVSPYRSDRDAASLEYSDEAAHPSKSVSEHARKAPLRTKSIPRQNLRVNIGEDRVVKCNSIHRHRQRGTWFLEVDLPDDYLLDDDGVVSNLSNLGSEIFEKVNPRSPSLNHTEEDGNHKSLLNSISDYFAGGEIPKVGKLPLHLDSDAELQTPNKALNSEHPESFSLTSTPRSYGPSQPVSQPLLSSSYHQNRRLPKNSPRNSENVSNSTWNQKLPQSQTSSDLNDAHLRQESARSSKSPISTGSSSSASSDKFHTAPPSPARVEIE